MLISVSFSLAIYHVLTDELNRVERVQRLRQERRIFILAPGSPRTPSIDPEVMEESKNRLKSILVLVNLGILGASSLAGYFLAGRTLRPISQMLDEQNRFITDASHELRTPLTSLKSEIEVNLRDKDLTLKTTKNLLQSNLEEVNNLQYLSDNLIKLTQYQKENAVSFEAVNLKEVSGIAQRKVANLAKRKNIIIKNEVNDGEISGGWQSLIELFVVFLDNAIKYSPKGKTVTLTSRKIDRSIEVEIRDQGMGIEEKDIPHLFDRFFRADKSRTKAEAGGYGLGLSIAKQIVDKHQGSIRVESKLDKGSVFTLRFPLRYSF